MKIIRLIFISMIAVTGFADNLTLENQTPYPNQKSKVAVQWANSAKEVNEENQAIMHGSSVKQESLQVLTQKGKINLNIPKKAEYFRVIAWLDGEKGSELITNWVDVVPNKTYTLKEDHLVPSILMLGMGC